MITESSNVAGSLSFRLRLPVSVVRSSESSQVECADLVEVGFDVEVEVGVALAPMPLGDALMEPVDEGDDAVDDGRFDGVGEAQGVATGGAVGQVGAAGGGSAETADAPLEFMITAAAATTTIRPTPRIIVRRSQ